MPRDVANAAHVADLSGVVLHPLATDAHDTSRLVRDSGELVEILGRVDGLRGRSGLGAGRPG
jgi:hypothetical protein